MLFSQLALIVLVVLAMVTGNLPWWLGVGTIVAWVAAKLVMRVVIGQVERRDLKTQRMAGSRLDVHGVERVIAESGEEADAEHRYWLDVTIAPPHSETEWYPLELEVFEIKGESPHGCPVETCMVWRGDTFVPCTEAVRGAARVRLLIAAMPSTRSVVLAHQDERLGTVRIMDN